MSKLTPIAFIFALSVQSSLAFEANPGCGSSVGCFYDCDKDCTFEVSWKDQSDKVEMTIKADLPTVSAGGDWLSLGFSADQKMGDDQVIDCITDGTNTFIQHSFNVGSPKFNRQEDSSPSWITEKTKSYANGELTCSFDVAKTNTPNLNMGTDWYLLLGDGKWNGNLKSKHQDSPKISSVTADFQSFDVIGGAGQNIMLKLHGIMMISAWILFTSIGIVVARYYKPVWLEEKLCGEKVWFSVHRGLMISAVSFCIAGFVIIFVEKKKFEEVGSDSDFKKAHPFIGIIVMSLAIIQPLMALLRPHPDEKYRFVFNWAHWAVGFVVHVLAVINIVIGVLLDAMQMPIWVCYVVVAYACYQILIEFFLEIHDCCVRNNQKSSDAYEMREINSQSKADKKTESTNRFKKMVLGLHVFIIIGFSTALIVMVAMDLSELSEHDH